MTLEELSAYNGRNGQPAYVAVSGIIYDVSESPLWRDGNHEGAHYAGCDLTAELKTAPHVAAVVERFPSVGRLERPAEPEKTSSPKIIVIAVAVLAAALAIYLAF